MSGQYAPPRWGIILYFCIVIVIVIVLFCNGVQCGAGQWALVNVIFIILFDALIHLFNSYRPHRQSCGRRYRCAFVYALKRHPPHRYRALTHLSFIFFIFFSLSFTRLTLYLSIFVLFFFFLFVQLSSFSSPSFCRTMFICLL